VRGACRENRPSAGIQLPTLIVQISWVQIKPETGLVFLGKLPMLLDQKDISQNPSIAWIGEQGCLAINRADIL
jgi:hypothetical protein